MQKTTSIGYRMFYLKLKILCIINMYKPVLMVREFSFPLPHVPLTLWLVL